MLIIGEFNGARYLIRTETRNNTKWIKMCIVNLIVSMRYDTLIVHSPFYSLI